MKIDEIKKGLSITRVLGHYNIEIGKNNHIHCPFHDDKTPSMRVYTETNTVYCFSGNCRTHGKSLDVIELVKELEGCTKHEAIVKCKTFLGYTPTVPAKSRQSAHEQIWKVLQKSLSSSDRARKYLRSRGLSLKGVGYHSGQLGKTGKGKYKEIAEASNLINESGKAWASGCIIYPLKDALGRVVSYYGRSLYASHTGHFYQSGRSGLYPRWPKKEAKKVLLVESVIDAHSITDLEVFKDYEVLALYGTNGFTKDHEKALKSLKELEEVALMMDGDEAGRAASEHYEKELLALLPGVELRVINLPGETDVNELWANHLSEELFVELLVKSQEKVVTKELLKSTDKLESKLDSRNPENLKYEGIHGKYYVKGLGSIKGLDSLKVTLIIAANGKKSRGKVELYEDREVEKYCRSAGEKLGLSSEQLELDINLLTDELESYRESITGEEPTPSIKPKVELSSQAKAKAQTFLKAPNLLKRLNELIGKTGIVGEEQTRLLLFIVASSYKCSHPLHALIQGSSGTGKTLLLRKIMSLLPDEDHHVWTRISDKSLYHAGTRYKHKAIAIEDWDGLSEEVHYVIRELQSGQRLSSTITEKQANGKFDNKEILAEGPISSLMCTTHGAIYEDNMSRCFLVAVDESEEQTKRILAYQYAKDRGEINKQAASEAVKEVQNLVAVLHPKEVVNPYAGRLELPPSVHKIRRLNDLFQTFVRQIVWLHQYQRATDEQGRLIATKGDLQQAIDLLFETIMLKVDELDGSLRQFYERLKGYVKEQGSGSNYEFGRLEIRQVLNVSKTQQHRYMQQLLDLDYIRQMGGYANKGYKYQVQYWDDNKKLRLEIQSSLQSQLSSLD